MSKSWANGSTRRWRELRAAVLLEARRRVALEGGALCALRTEVCVGESVPMHVHHLNGKANGDRDLVAACAPCNLHVGDPLKGEDPQCVPISRWA